MSSTPRHRVLVATRATALKLDGLINEGFEPFWVGSAGEALVKARAETFDVVIAEVKAPAIDGVGLARQLHDENVLAPVLLIDSKVTDEDRLAAAEEGITQLLELPLGRETLVRALKFAVAQGGRRRSVIGALLGSARDATTFSATEAKNQMGAMLETALTEGAVVLTKHDRPAAALVSLERLETLARHRSTSLERLSRDFDAMLARMQTPKAKAGIRRAFGATAAELAKAAVKAGRRRA